jgi:hypothetical protein
MIHIRRDVVSSEVLQTMHANRFCPAEFSADSAVRCEVQDCRADSEWQSLSVQHESEKQQQETSKWQAKQKNILQALTPSLSNQQAKASERADTSTVDTFGVESHGCDSATLPETNSVYDNAECNGSVSLRYKDVSTLFSVMEIPGPVELTEDAGSECCSLSAMFGSTGL